MYVYEFRNRKPSCSQVYKMIMHAVNSGHEKIEIIYEKSSIEILYGNGFWNGFGCIKDISGDDMALSIELTLRELA